MPTSCQGQSHGNRTQPAATTGRPERTRPAGCQGRHTSTLTAAVPARHSAAGCHHVHRPRRRQHQVLGASLPGVVMLGRIEPGGVHLRISQHRLQHPASGVPTDDTSPPVRAGSTAPAGTCARSVITEHARADKPAGGVLHQLRIDTTTSMSPSATSPTQRRIPPPQRPPSTHPPRHRRLRRPSQKRQHQPYYPQDGWRSCGKANASATRDETRAAAG